MKSKSALAAGLAGLLLAPVAAGAAEQHPEVIRALAAQGIEVKRSFPAASGLRGWLLASEGQYSIVFTTADGKTLLSGTLLDASGRNLTALYAERYVPRPDYREAFAELERAVTIPEGTLAAPKSTVYVVFDPNCPFCHALWLALQPYEKAGLQVRWLPVAYLRPTSHTKAAAMLEAENPTLEFRRIMEGFGANDAQYAGRTVSDRARRVLEANARIMRAFGLSGTPAIVWRDGKGRVQVTRGMPRLPELAAITGLPEQPQSDPRLARFK